MSQCLLALSLFFCVSYDKPVESDLAFIYLVRHAEKQEGDNASLTSQGQQRAENYAEFFEKCGVAHIFSTEFRRTHETAAPLAKKLSLEVESYDKAKLQAFAEQLKSLGGSVLVVGHSNTTVDLVEFLGGEAGTPIDEPTEYDRVYQLTVQDGKVIHTNLFQSSNR